MNDKKETQFASDEEYAKLIEKINHLHELGIGTNEILSLLKVNSKFIANLKASTGITKKIMAKRHEQIDDLVSNGIQIRIIGDIESLPKSVYSKLLQAIDLTKNNDKLVLNLAINYGSRNEIINAVKIISKKVKNNEILIDDKNEDLFNDKLYTALSPYPDLLIRTGGESRLSNFLLWQLAYSEIIVNDSFWPDYKVENLKFDINKFSIKERRFGKTSEQLNY